MQELIPKLLKQVCGDFRSLIVQKFLVWIFAGCIGVSLLLQQSRDVLIAILHKRLPVWITILLLLFSFLLFHRTYRYLSEKQKSNYINRASKIERWRSFIDNFDFKNNNFGDTTIYSELRSYMNKNDIDFFENPLVFRATKSKRGDFPQKQVLADLVSKIEKDWNLS